jgi:hypothetical protein
MNYNLRRGRLDAARADFADATHLKQPFLRNLRNLRLLFSIISES